LGATNIAKRAAADIEGHSPAAKFSQPGRLSPHGQIFRHSHAAIAIVQMPATMRMTTPQMPK
jgi:hypothetical protein